MDLTEAVTVIVSRKMCPLCAVKHEVRAAVPEKEVQLALLKWEQGELIQNCFPFLSSSDREILISGFCQKAWDVAMQGG